MKVLEIFENKLRYKNYSQRTIGVYKSYLKNFINSCNIKDYHNVTTKQIVNFLENHKFSSTSQQNQYIGCLKLYAKYILNKKDIHLSKIERPKSEKKLPQVIDNQSILEKLSKIKNIKHKAILTLTYSVGLRVSEIINLKIEDIDSKRMIIHIKNAKGRKDRIVPLSQNVLDTLRLYFKEYKPQIYLFNGQTNLQYSIKSCQNIFKKYIDENSHIHTLRHSCFTNLLENGTDIRIIKKLAGHSNIKTTEIYTNVSNKILSDLKLPI